MINEKKVSEFVGGASAFIMGGAIGGLLVSDFKVPKTGVKLVDNIIVVGGVLMLVGSAVRVAIDLEDTVYGMGLAWNQRKLKKAMKTVTEFIRENPPKPTAKDVSENGREPAQESNAGI